VQTQARTYRDLEHLDENIRATVELDGRRMGRLRSGGAIDRAHMNHADVLVFREMFNDWVRPHGGE